MLKSTSLWGIINMQKQTKQSLVLARIVGELAPLENLRAVAKIRRVMPNLTDKTLARYIAAGFVGEKLDLALELSERHRSNITSIVTWHTKKGISMPRLRLCLGIRDEYGMYQMSVILISRYLAQMGFSEHTPTEVEEIPESVVAILELFMEIAERIGGDFPVHRVYHRVEEEFGNNVLEAYHMAVEDERLFIQLILGKVSRNDATIKLHRQEIDIPDEADEDSLFDNGSGQFDPDTARFVENVLRYQE